MSDNGFYTGFVGPTASIVGIEPFRDGSYFAAYKTIFDSTVKAAGDITQSRAVTTWGAGAGEARKLLFWSELLRVGSTPQPEAYADRGLIRMVTAAYDQI